MSLLIAALATASGLAITAHAAPKIASPNAIYEYGEMDNSENVKAEFIIKNEGDEVLVISDVKCACGCTVAQLAEADKRIEPGGEVKLPTTLSLANRQGEVSKTCTVTSNDPETPSFTLTLKGTAIAPIMFEPATLNFGKIMTETPEPLTLSIRAHDNEEFEIESVESSLEQVSTTVREVTPKKEYEIVAQVNSAFPEGNQIGRLIIKTTNEKRPVISVNVYGIGVGAFDVSPNVITYRQTETESTIDPVLRVGPGQVASFEITEVITPIPSMGVEIMPRPDSNYLIKLYGVPTDDSLTGKELVIHTNASSGQEIRVPFRPYAPVRQPAASK
jgi:hypothetical protein